MVATEALAGVAGVALFATPGAGLAELLPAVRAFSVGRRLAYAYLLGVAWTAGMLYALSHFLAVPLRPPAILATAAAPAVAGAVSWLLRRRRLRPSTPQRRRRPWEWLVTAVCAVISLAVLADALTNPVLDWDGWMTWAAQARYVRHEGTVDPTVLTQKGWYVSHPWYPLLLPVAQVAVLETTHADWDDPAFRPFYAAFFPVWLLVIYGGARALAGRTAAGWTTLAAALLPVPAFELAGGAVSAYSDLPLACFYGGALALLLSPRLRPSAGLAAGILLAAVSLTKAEGAVLAPAALVCGGLYAFAPLGQRKWQRRWHLRRGPLALAALPLVLALALLFSWRAGVPERFESYEKIVSWTFLWPGILTRAPRIASAVRSQMASTTAWGFFWWTAPLVLAAGWRGLRRRATVPLLLGAAAPLAVAWISYTISLTPEFIIWTSWNRFLIQASVPCLLLLALALANLLRVADAIFRRPGRRARFQTPSRCTPA